jgi:hypothetical protein
MPNFSFLGSFSGTSLGGRAAGRPGGRMLDFSKLRLTQPSLAGSGAELGKKEKENMVNSGLRLSDTVCTAPLGPKSWPPLFMPAAKGSARTPLGPTIFSRVNNDKLSIKICMPLIKCPNEIIEQIKSV